MKNRWVLPLLLLLALAVRIDDLAAQSLWYDDGYTIYAASHSVPEIVINAARLELNTPLHYVLFKGWTALAGTSEFSMRLVEVFFGVLTVLAGAKIAGRNQRAAALAGLLIALAPVAVSISHEVRQYAQGIALSTLSVALALRARRLGHGWMGWALCSLLAFGSHIFAALTFGATALVLLPWAWRARRAPGARNAIRAALISGALMAGVAALMLALHADYGGAYAARLDLARTLYLSSAALVLPRLLPAAWIPFAAALALIVWLGAARSRLRLALIAALSMVFIALLCIVTGKFAARYVAFATPLLLAALGHTRSRMSAGLALAASLAGLGLARAAPESANDDWRGATGFLQTRLLPGEVVLLVSGHSAPMLQYYWPQGEEGRAWTALQQDPVLDVRHALDYERVAPLLNTALAGARGAWLLTWQDEVSDPSNITRALLRRQSHLLQPESDNHDYHGLRLQHYRFEQPWQRIPETLNALAPRSQFEPNGQERGLRGLGCAQLAAPAPGRTLIEIACFWRRDVDAALPYDLQVSIRLIDAQGVTRAQNDGQLAADGLPGVRFDGVITTLHYIPLPADLPAGDYSLLAVPYIRDVTQVSPLVRTPLRISR